MAFSIIVSFRDNKNERSTTEINLPSGTAYDDVLLFAQEVVQLIDPLITGAIERVGIAATVDVSGLGLTAAPTVGSDVEEGARFQFRTALNNFTSLRLPTFDEAAIVPGTREVSQVDTDVAAFLTAMESGIDLTGVGGSGTIQPSDKRDEDIITTQQAREQFLSSRSNR